jgi:hypothetical protein
MRAPIDVPYLVDFETKLIQHLEDHGDADFTIPLPFTMKNVYDYLERRSISQQVPQELYEARKSTIMPASTTKSTLDSITQSAQLLANCEKQPQPITQIDNYYDLFVLTDPKICAFVRNKKNMCECCMTGPHPASKCFLRGLNFQPKELQQRINLYNKQHGYKPPEGQEPSEWNPRSLNLTH